MRKFASLPILAAPILGALLLPLSAQHVGAQPAPSPRAPAPGQPGEPHAVTQLRSLLGPDVVLRFQSATATDVSGGASLMGVSLRRGMQVINIAEARLEGLRNDGIARLSLRSVAIGGGAFPLTLDRLDLEGLTVQRPATGGPPSPEQVSADLMRVEGWRSGGTSPVNIGSILVENFGGGRAGQVNVTALEVRAPDLGVADRLTVARIAVAGVDTAEMLSAVMAQRPPRTSDGRASIDIEGVEVSQGGNAVARLSAFTLRGEVAPPRPRTGSLVIRGLEVLPVPPMAEWMQRFGYDRLRAEARVNATHDIATRQFNLQEFGIELRGIAELHLAMRLDGVDEDMTPAQRERARLISAVLRYGDQSLFERWVRSQATQERITEQALRQRLSQQAAVMLNGPTLASAREAAQRFIAGRATVLELAANPAGPLSFSMITAKPQTSLAGWQRMFGLTLTAR